MIFFKFFCMYFTMTGVELINMSDFLFSFLFSQYDLLVPWDDHYYGHRLLPFKVQGIFVVWNGSCFCCGSYTSMHPKPAEICKWLSNKYGKWKRFRYHTYTQFIQPYWSLCFSSGYIYLGAQIQRWYFAWFEPTDFFFFGGGGGDYIS